MCSRPIWVVSAAPKRSILGNLGAPSRPISADFGPPGRPILADFGHFGAPRRQILVKIGPPHRQGHLLEHSDEDGAADAKTGLRGCPHRNRQNKPRALEVVRP